MSLALHHVVKSYADTTAVKGLSFEVERGEIFGLIGPNGAGKTTTMRMIIGMIKPDEGWITWLGEPLQASFNDRIGYMPEERGLYRRSRVLDTIVFFAKLKGLSKKTALAEAHRWLEKTELSAYATHRLEALSKGMQQKIQFICTVLHKPELVILDEPFSGLDPVNQNLMRAWIRELADAGMTVIFSAHQMTHVEKLCRRICMMHHGVPVLHDTIAAIRRRHDDGRIRLTGSAEALREVQNTMAWSSLHISDQVLDGIPPAPMSFNQILQRIATLDGIEGIERVHPTLEDIFLKVTKD
ncbi:MAG TPA: ATP-binding cassette domain-containing protein [bacterium]|nr:ATP-binding cassette domain-containing protein [bacterium]